MSTLDPSNVSNMAAPGTNLEPEQQNINDVHRRR